MNKSDKITWTGEELDEFDRLIDMTCSSRQMDRIEGRIDMQNFIKKHGEEKCNAMFEILKRKER